MARVLSRQDVKSFYDGFGAKQDLQRFYEDPAVRVLESHADLANARAVVEFGCGTGRMARRLLDTKLGPDTTYVGLDVSDTMVRLARERLAAHGDRTRVVQTDGSPVVPLPDDACDRFLVVYVLDLLSEGDARAVLDEARRVLVPAGLLCVANLTFGETPATRVVSALWSAAFRTWPRLVGGCRPIRLRERLGQDWTVLAHDVVRTFGLSTEIAVARPTTP